MCAARFTTIIGLLLAGSAGTLRAAGLDFQRDILPLLSDRCYHCHGPDAATRKGGLRLDTEEGAFSERSGRRALVRGKSAESELYRRIASSDPSERMPPPDAPRSLSHSEIELLRKWIDEGAVWGRHWAYVAPTRPQPPAVRQVAWPRNALDAFVLDRLEREGLDPAPGASPRALLRRVSLDLTGLPPTPEELDLFLADLEPLSYERAVDRLLASPAYGEHMAWAWLDAARYADTNGYQGDPTRTMWPWRDGLVRALDEDVPFDQLTLESLAGDLLPDATIDQRIASGFHRNHALNAEGGRIPEESRVDYVFDRVETTAAVWLGLTLGCARCHDHKYDPFTQREYYQLYAYFNSVSESGMTDEWPHAKPVIALPTEEEGRELARLEARVADLGARLKPPAGAPAGAGESRGEEKAALEKDLAEAERSLRSARTFQTKVMVMDELGTPRETHVLLRGAYDKPGEKVSAGVPALLHPLPPGAPPSRLSLARWIVDPANPLTARVTVNREWQRFFGAGLVRTTEDFGVQGERPSHPALLDWLATELVRSGWSLKAIHRLMVTSATYRQASAVSPLLLERDPENRLLARGPRFRLSSAALRDQALLASGLLSFRRGGPPVKPYQPAGVWEEMTFGQISYREDTGEKLYRRSLYTFWRRTVAPTSFFDVPSRQACAVRVARTNTPLHALNLLNDPTYVEAARKLAERTLLTELPGDEGRLSSMLLRVVARPPSPRELPILLGALARLRAHYAAEPGAAGALLQVGAAAASSALDPNELAAWAGVASLVLNLDEAITRN